MLFANSAIFVSGIKELPVGPNEAKMTMAEWPTLKVYKKGGIAMVMGKRVQK